MNAADLLHRLDDLGVVLTCDGPRVRYRSHGGQLPQELLATMKLHRDELAYLVSRRSQLPRQPIHDERNREHGGPLTRTQRSVWATDFFRSDGAYNLCGALRLRGRLDTAALTAALTDLQDRHPSLRTVFGEQQGKPRQRVLAAVPLPFTRRRLDTLAPEPAFETCLKECAELVNQALPVDSAPPVRMRLYQLAEEDHVFFVVLHHVIADGESLGVLLDDLARCYNARLTGGTADAAPAGPDMIDYARWEEDFYRFADTSAARRYWRDQLAGATPGPLPLPPAETGEPGTGGGLVTVIVDAATTAAVRRLASTSRSSVFTVASAAISAMLQRYTGRDDLVVGMPVTRRDREGLARLVGLLLDMVPVRLDVGGSPSFLDLVHRTRRVVLGAMTNVLPPDHAAADIGGGRAGGPQGAGYNVVLTDAGVEGLGPRFQHLDVSRVDVEQATAKYDLNFLIRERGDRLVFDVEFDRRAVAEQDVRAMLSTARRILAHGVRATQRRLAELAAAPPAEVGAGAVGAPADRVPQAGESLISRFLAIADRRGDAMAISCDGETISYRDLYHRVDQVARGLRRQGVGPGEVIAVVLPRGIDLITAMLAIMGSGAASLVLDESWPEQRSKEVLADAGVRRVIAAEPGPADGHVTLAELARLGEQESAPLQAVPGTATAYVIYTSGSTGRPKGVWVTHRNVLSLLDSTSRAFGFGVDDCWTQFHSCSFDFSTWEVFGCLLHGGRLVVVPKWVTREPEVFANLLRRERVTVLNQTPSALSVTLPAIARVGSAALALRYVIFGGEALERGLVDQWYRAMGDEAQLVNMYGITETTVHASWLWLRPGQPRSAESDIGEPLPGTALHVLHRNGSPVLNRCVGEIYVGGPQVSDGYLGRPRETALRFVPDPYSPVPGSRMYRSGDFGRRNRSGIAYLGRRDGQVQVHGFRVELPEIERALAGRPGVAAAAAAVATDDGDPRIVAAVVLDARADVSAAELRAGVRGTLPAYMVPHVVYPVDKLPLTANGKLDRAAVAAAGTRATMADRPAQAPRTAEEALVLELAREVLGGAAGLTDDFFSLGGDSMRAIRLVGLARDRGLFLTVQDCYDAADLGELAARAVPGPTGGESARPGRVPFDGVAGGRDGFPDDVVDAYPMTALQTGMVYHRELAPSSGSYHIVLSYRVGGVMVPEAFRSAVRAVMDRHPVLRTSFDLADARGPMQRVHRAVPAPVVFHDISELTPDEQETMIAAVVEAESAAEFDLSRPGVFRLVVLTRSARDYQLVFSHHHAILDGWSVNIFFEDLHERYEQLLDGGSPEAGRPAPRTTFADYVALELRAADDPEHREFWRARVPSDVRLLAPGQGAHPVMRQIRVELPEGTITQLSAVAQQATVPLKAVLLAAHMRVMSWLLGHDDVVTGLTTACRPEEADADRMLGLFLNELPLRIRLGNQTWLELARQVHAEEVAMMRHRWYPHALIQRDHDSGPILDSNFNFTDFHTTKALVRSGSLEVLDIHEIESTHYPLGINYTIDVRTRELRLIVEYDAAALTRRTAELTAAAHRRVLAAIVAAPDATCVSAALPGVVERIGQYSPEPKDAATERRAARTPARDAVRPGSATDAGEATAGRRHRETELQRSVREIWVDVLGHDRYDSQTSFFAAGGSSLTAMQVVSRLRARHGQLSMSTFMNAPTIAGIARALSDAPASGGGRTDAEPGRQQCSGGPRRYPLSPAQQQMWLLAGKLPHLPLFGMPGALQVDGPLDTELLVRAFNSVVSRHEALRTRFVATGGTPDQVVDDAAELSIPVVDLRDHPDPGAACEKAMVVAALEPIALDQAPLMRAAVYQIGDQRHVVYANIHHIVCDGWSLRLLLRDVAQAYRDLVSGVAPSARRSPLGGGQLALDRARWRQSREAAQQRDYWVRQLAGPWPSLADGPASRLRRAGVPGLAESFRLANCSARLPAAAVHALRDTARRHDLTDFMVVLTAYAATLHAWSGRDDIRIGTLVANRTGPGTDECVGLLANTVVLRLDVAAAPGRAALSRHARQVCLDAYDHQEVPFEDLLPALAEQSPPGQRGGPVFEAMLVMQEETRAADLAGGLTVTPYLSDSGVLGTPIAPTTSDFVLAVAPAGDELAFELLYKPSAAASADARALLDDIVAAVPETVYALEQQR